MGTLNYAEWSIEFDDRVLAHLQIVIINRFRTGESLLMSWIDSPSIGDGRSSIWLSPALPLYFKFSGSRTPSIDTGWLRLLSESAARSTGLIVTDEHGDVLRIGRPGILQRTPRPTTDHQQFPHN